jgi:hypothetical protein
MPWGSKVSALNTESDSPKSYNDPSDKQSNPRKIQSDPIHQPQRRSSENADSCRDDEPPSDLSADRIQDFHLYFYRFHSVVLIRINYVLEDTV